MLGNQIIQLRKDKGITQEALAEVLGVSMQAVSKWENDTCCPDIGLLVPLSEYFGVTIDYLFGRTVAYSSVLDLPTDNKLRIIQYKNGRVLGQNEWDKNTVIKLAIAEQDQPNRALALEVWGSIEVKGDINGNVNAGAQVNCGDIEGNLSAGAQVNCGDVNGNTSAGGSVNCGDVSGNAGAGNMINCSDVGGNAGAGSSIKCGDVDGDVNAGGTVNCGDVDGDVKCEADIECCEISGKVECKGNISYRTK